MNAEFAEFAVQVLAKSFLFNLFFCNFHKHVARIFQIVLNCLNLSFIEREILSLLFCF